MEPKKSIELTDEQIKRFLQFVDGDDMDFYEEYIIHLSGEEQEKFFEDNPDFMSEFHVNRNKLYMLKDKSYRSILKRIKKYEEYSHD